MPTAPPGSLPTGFLSVLSLPCLGVSQATPRLPPARIGRVAVSSYFWLQGGCIPRALAELRRVLRIRSLLAVCPQPPVATGAGAGKADHSRILRGPVGKFWAHGSPTGAGLSSLYRVLGVAHSVRFFTRGLIFYGSISTGPEERLILCLAETILWSRTSCREDKAAELVGGTGSANTF